MTTTCLLGKLSVSSPEYTCTCNMHMILNALRTVEPSKQDTLFLPKCRLCVLFNHLTNQDTFSGPLVSIQIRGFPLYPPPPPVLLHDAAVSQTLNHMCHFLLGINLLLKQFHMCIASIHTCNNMPEVQFALLETMM